MILLFSLYFLNIILIQSSKNNEDFSYYKLFLSSCIESYEIPRTISNDFLKSKISFRNKYEEARETMETKREVTYFFIFNINFLYSPVLMNINNMKSLINGVIYYPRIVHNIARKQ